jgi:hypothetical protein
VDAREDVCPFKLRIVERWVGVVEIECEGTFVVGEIDDRPLRERDRVIIKGEITDDDVLAVLNAEPPLAGAQ